MSENSLKNNEGFSAGKTSSAENSPLLLCDLPIPRTGEEKVLIQPEPVEHVVLTFIL